MPIDKPNEKEKGDAPDLPQMAQDLWARRAERWDANQPVRLVSIQKGAEFEVDLSAFPEAEPLFAYVDTGRDRAEALSGFEIVGRMTIQSQSPYFNWSPGPRDCVLLKANPEGVLARRAAFRSLAVGEFFMEVYHVRPDTSVEFLRSDYFWFS